jgi:predicted exporter
MRWRGRVVSLVVVLATALGVALAAPRFRFTTAITHFLPDESDPGGAKLAGLLADSETARVMVLDLSGAPPPDLRSLTAALIAFLRARADVDSAHSGVTDEDAAAILAFLASFPGSTFVPASAHTESLLRARLTELQDQLASPLSMLLRPIAPRDPLGGVWRTLAMLRQARSQTLVDDDGILFTADRSHAFVFVETRASPFDTEAQSAFRAVLDGWMRSQAPPAATLQTAGAAQIAINSEAQIKGDINRIGIVSTVGTVALFLVLFGSVRLIALGLFPMLFGSAVALVVCHLAYGAIHGITVAFGASLLGLGIDYVEHFYTHLALDPATDPRATMRSVGPSIALGALTTVIGFVGIAASGVAGLREMALFSVVAIAASLGATYFLLPPWIPRSYRPPRTLARLDRLAYTLLDRLTRRPPTRTQRGVVLVAALAAAGIGFGTARFSDNVSVLVDDHGPPMREERQVRARLGDDEASTFAVVTGRDDEELLGKLDRVDRELAEAHAAGAVASFVPLASLVPSRSEQLLRRAAARAAAPMLRGLLVDLGFVPEQFEPYFDSLEAPEGAVLTLEALRRSPLAPFFAFWAPRSATPTILVPLGGVRDVDDLGARVTSATVMAPSRTVTALFRGVRLRTLVASALGLLAIFALLAIRYRGFRRATAALLPALLGCIVTVIVLSAAQVALTILHIMALLLVVSLGVDFGIFFVEKADSLADAARTLVSILTASLTTVLSFGLLSISNNPGLAALGITLTLGTVFGMVSCVLVAWWLGQSRVVA